MIQRGVLTQHERLIHGQAVEVPKLSHNLGLLDRVNSEFTFQVLIQFDEVSRVTRVLDNDLDNLGGNIPILGCNRCCRSWRFGQELGFEFLNRRGFCHRYRFGGTRTQVGNHVIQRGVLTQHERLIHGQAVEVPKLSHNLGLLDRVNSEFTFQVLIQFDEVSRVTRVLDNDLDNLGGNVCRRDR